MTTRLTPPESAEAAIPAPLTHREIAKRLLPYLIPQRRNLILGLLCGLVAGLVPVGVMGMIKTFIESAQKGSEHLSDVSLICAAVVGLYAVLWVFNYLQSVLLADVAQRVGMQMRADVYAHLQSLSLAYFHKRRTGALMSTLTNDVPKLQNAAMMVRNVITTPVVAVTVLIILFRLSWKLMLCALIVVPFMVLAIQFLSRKLRDISSESQSRMADVNAVMEETLSSARVVKAFAAEKHEIARFNHVSGEAVAVAMRGVRRTARLSPTIDLIGAFSIAGLLWVGGAEIVAGELSFGTLIAFVYGANQLTGAIGSLGNLRNAWEEMMGAADHIFHDVLDVVPDVRDLPGAVALPPIQGLVEFDHVFFSYDKNGAIPTLSDINLTIEPGQIVALVGETGAGKSTLADLVPRFYDPTSGVIRIDGCDIRTVTMESLRRQIGIVPQETLLFSGSIKSNIAYGKHDATDAEIEAAARAANADSFIQSFPAKYETIIGERGATLSGGERQRVAIARALLADPRLLILDEATSALDAATEALVQEALEMLMQNRTTIIIAHRLSTIVKADKIVVLRRGGTVAEVGTHAELLDRRGVYAALYETQQRSAELALPS